MEIFELGIERIHNLISSCLSLVVWQGLIYGISAFFLGLLINTICKKYKLFVRKNQMHQLIVHNYFVFIPMLFFSGGIILGSALAAKDFFAKETKQNIAPLMKLIFPAYQSETNNNWARVLQTRMTFTESVDEYVSAIKFVPRNNEIQEEIFTHAANFMVPKITKWGIESIVSSARDIALRQSDEQGYIEINKVKALLIVRTMSFFDYPAGLWEESAERLEKKIMFYFSGVVGNVSIIFLFLFLFPFIETLIYYLNQKNNSRKANSSLKLYDENISDKFSKKKSVTTQIDMEIPKVFEN